MLRSVATTPKSASRTSFHPRSPTSGTYARFRSFGLLLASFIAAALLVVAASRTTRSHAHHLDVLHALGLQARDRKALLRWVVAWPSLLVLATALPLGMLLGHRWWEHEATILGLQRRVSVAWSLDALAIGVPLLVAVVFAGMLGHRRSESDALRAE